MGYSRFRLNVIIRILVILLLGYLSIYIILYTHFWLVGLWTILGCGIAIYNLIRFLESSHREMANFLTSIKQGDFTNTYTGKKKENPVLMRAFSDISEVFQKLSTERETHHQFLQTVVEHVSVALVAFDGEGNVILFNHSAQKLFNQSHARNINSLKVKDPQLAGRLEEIAPGNGELIKLLSDGELLNLSIRATQFVLQGKTYKIVTLQNIQSELEEKEVESWQKLIRVLTHEIMNSAIPISTLSSVISGMLEDDEGEPVSFSDLDEEVLVDVLGGLKTIEGRSKGLVKFVDAYKSLTKIDPPEFEEIQPAELIAAVLNLLVTDLEAVEFKKELNEEIRIKGDKELLEQVLINLLKNACEALHNIKQPQIEIRCYRDGKNQNRIMIRDNGEGISPDDLENIFIPFFSTKKTGSGIGLSLSRQIMRLHKGSISVSSIPGVETKFELVF